MPKTKKKTAQPVKKSTGWYIDIKYKGMRFCKSGYSTKKALIERLELWKGLVGNVDEFKKKNK